MLRDVPRWAAGVVESGAQPDVGPGAMGMSADEHGNVLRLLSGHAAITRKVEEIPGGVKTTTTTTRPELVETLRAHVRQMSRHLEQGQPVRMWDPVFRDIFAHHDEITLVAKDIEGGIEVTETSENPEVVPLIRPTRRRSMRSWPRPRGGPPAVGRRRAGEDDARPLSFS